MFYIYILYSENFDKYYVGYSEYPFERINQHNFSPFNSATSPYRPWEFAALFECSSSRSEIMKIEKFIKKQHSKTIILKLIDRTFKTTGILAQLVRVPHLRN